MQFYISCPAYEAHTTGSIARSSVVCGEIENLKRNSPWGGSLYSDSLALSRSAWLGKLIATTPSSLSGGVYHWVATHRPFLSSLFGRGSHDAIPSLQICGFSCPYRGD